MTSERGLHRIHFTATAEIRMGPDGLDLVLAHGGRHPDLPREQTLPATWRERIEWPDGTVTAGVSEPSTLWYIETPTQRIVVDSGLSAANVAFANEVFQRRQLHQHYVHLPDSSVERFLAAHGTRPEEIDLVVLTHLHLDHFPNAPAFTRARFLVHVRELAAGLAPAPHDGFHWREFAPYLLQVIDRVEIVHGDMQIEPGIEVWHVGGHSQGQLAVVVQTRAGTVVLGSDFFSTYKSIELSWPPGIYTNLDEWESNARRLRRVADVIVPGHDWSVWERHPDQVIG
ncbi:N-acyl homoserine lactonase family protein [Conexibacter sp. CPCC 206217]|uniref:N-acyl homoserine lactonase family protein n=1 Tax=Conexibacter sp. CPCC 206217 TaxID=3064574 RepID=UPI0027255CE9|nr:N-acyl homoserine lactonase family protein [Conexibacter sp. CPCC 206217]MDO8211030.1 N-acyl homoserine lactonase family protein [Conexibacter sp. CPCC 206217]